MAQETAMEIVIGTKNWSTWSLRPWLALKRCNVDFVETLVPLRWDTSTEAIAVHSPTGLVPVLKDGALTIWDSLAICEYLNDRFPEAKLWPADPTARALARSATAEMHSGFGPLRKECPMEIDAVRTVELSAPAEANIRRIVALWSQLRAAYQDQGPFLVGDWSIADAFYTPVATRFRTYGIDLAAYGDEGLAAAYCEALLSTPEFLEWQTDC
jgi:glutathione S-transferase